MKKRSFVKGFLCLAFVFILACGIVSTPPAGGMDPSAQQTDIALRVWASSVANQQILTMQALQAQMTFQAQATPTAENIPPTLPQPTQEIPVPPPTQTTVPTAAPLVLEIQLSTDTFYCYQPPYQLTITALVSNIDRGMAVYYHIEDKSSGVRSEGQKIDLHRRTGNTRAAAVIGGGNGQNLQFPPLMGESWFIYQIVSDDALYRSPVYSNVTFYPCAQ